MDEEQSRCPAHDGGDNYWSGNPAGFAQRLRVTGVIYDLWVRNRGTVGEPTSAEYRVLGGTRQDFAHATKYSSAEGAAILRGAGPGEPAVRQCRGLSERGTRPQRRPAVAASRSARCLSGVTTPTRWATPPRATHGSARLGPGRDRRDSGARCITANRPDNVFSAGADVPNYAFSHVVETG